LPMISTAISEATARAFVENQEQQAKQAQEKERANKEAIRIKSELAAVKQESPEYFEKGSPLNKAAVQWMDTYLGKFDPDTGQVISKGLLDDATIANLRTNPRLMMSVIKSATSSSVTTNDKEMERLRTENENMRKRLNLDASPLPPSAPLRSKTKGASDLSADDLLKALEEISESAA